MKRKVLFLTAALMLAAVLLCSCTFNFGNSMVYDVYTNAEKYSVGSFEYGRDGIKKVVIDWVSGKVEVEEDSGETLKVVEDSESLDEDKRVHYFIDDGVLRIRFCKSGYTGTFTPDEIDKNKTVSVSVPEKIDIEINSVSADVAIFKKSENTVYDNPNTVTTAREQSVKIATTSGDIKMGSLSCNDIKFSSVSGDVTVGKIKCKDAKFESTSGDVSVIGSFTTLDAKSVSGSMSFDVSGCTSAKIESVSGKIETSGSLSLLTAKAISGDIKVNAVFAEADLSATSGDITIGKFGGTLTFSTASGKLKTNIPHTEDDKKYTFGDSGQTAKVGTVSGNLYVE